MRVVDGRLSFSPTDLANFLACRHKAELDRLVAEGWLAKPRWVDPLAEVLRHRGDQHERRYVDALRAAGLCVVDLGATPRDGRLEETIAQMARGADVIVQAALAGNGWSGYADVLRRVESPSPVLGAWSYEVHDTKLARETRGGTVLQLCVYSELLADAQGAVPESFHVVTPLGKLSYRFDDFGAFYRQVKRRFVDFVAAGAGNPETTVYPEPVDHCAVCRWASRCAARRRADDHLALVANMGRHHRTELCGGDVRTRTALAGGLPAEFKPARGARATYERLHHQARLQVKQEASQRPEHELLPIDPEFGLTQLPEPRPGDLFLDLEGDPFGRPVFSGQGESGREYLFGLGRLEADGSFAYRGRWAFDDAQERSAFESVMTEIMAALEQDPAIHVYHYAPYEPSAFKRLMGRYAARESEVDRLLRGRRFVDLYAIVRHAIRAGVERYSIKNLEPFYGFARDVPLDEAGDQRRIVEIALETDDAAAIAPEVRAAVEGYNKDDCRSTARLREWLESLRDAQVAAGAVVPRPPLTPDEPSEKVAARQQRVNELRAGLLEGVPGDPAARTPDEQARYLLAYLLDWHYVEDRVVWWEYFRLLGLSDEELLDEPAAVAGLELVGIVEEVRNIKTGKPTGSVVKRYRYPSQECEIREGATLRLRDRTEFGKVVALDRSARTLDVKRSAKAVDAARASAFAHEQISAEIPAAALYRLGQQVADGGLGAAPRAAADLLLRRTSYRRTPRREGEDTGDYGVRVVGDLAETTLPIQGPPGSGKTFTGGRMIVELVRQGRRVGVTATSHKVIRNLLRAVVKEAQAQGVGVRIGHRVNDPDDDDPGVVEQFTKNELAHDALAGGKIDVLGGTAWLWSRPEFANSADVLFVDEAGQMSLANALAVSQAARSLVLLGDPQQLQQPQQGSHPDGTDVSALDHVLGAHKTMPAERGLFLPVTWRLAPSICDFTSEVFYESKLTPRAGLERQRLKDLPAGLYVVDVDHDGCRNASAEEADAVASLVEGFLQADAAWVDRDGISARMTADDVLVVAAYNAQVTRVQERLGRAGGPAAGVRVGTVDRFQGQEAPVVIYSMATSAPEDAPRGMEFLYSLNRLNVATSRARCVCVLVASPRLFEPACGTPRQMQLANALARYREMAQPCTRGREVRKRV